jgi:hypothetical protein
MAGRGPAIHVFLVCVGQKTWVAGPSPAMTVGATHGLSSMSFGIIAYIGLDMHNETIVVALAEAAKAE